MVLRSRSCLQRTLSSSLQRRCGSWHDIWIPDLGTISSRDDKADLVIWCDFSGFFNEVDSWGCVEFLCCLAEIFVVFWVGFVGIFRKFHCEFTKGFMCCLAEIFAGFLDGFCWDF